ncbi:MAG: response regulator [Methylobacterium sp.]|uniref:response regulator n=1 Tax=Methylobacterium sp. TaxID=409 RepID=UPI00258B9859|nr:response regulator [Methylobacterium sp.]MBY0295305.1 response regulator [Methylobacterium sp.]
MSTPAPDAADRTILIVEDEVLIRLVIADYLRDCGYRVHEASQADEAVTILNTPGLHIDVVFSDVEMPKGSMDGFGLARWVRTHHPGIPVILTSGAARSAEIAADLCETGPLLGKPYEPVHVVDRIRRLLAQRPGPGAAGSEPAARCA